MVKGIEKGCDAFATKKMAGLPDFSSLSADDQTKLIASNVPLLHVFQEAGCVGDPDAGLTKGNTPTPWLKPLLVLGKNRVYQISC